MQYSNQLRYWKATMLVTVLTLISLCALSFYGLYTDEFYFFKLSNYIIPFLAIVHCIYLYVMWFKIKERETTDPQMRNLEYALYIFLLIYGFKALDTFNILMSQSEYENHMIPANFIPLGITIFCLYFFLILLTFLSFKMRKTFVGDYNFENMTNIDSWE